MLKLLYQTKWFNLDEQSLYDKIINVCFYLENITDPTITKKIMIRSDYAPYYKNPFLTNDKSYVIKRVEQKPDIQVEMTNYTGTGNIISVNCNMTISNFFYFDTEGGISQNFGQLNIDQSSYRIAKIIFQLGYMSNFKAWFDRQGDTIKRTDLENNFEQVEENIKFGISTFVAEGNLFYITTEGIPPNAKTNISFYIGNVTPNDTFLPNSFNLTIDVNQSEIMTNVGDITNIKGIAREFLVQAFSTIEVDKTISTKLPNIENSNTRMINLLSILSGYNYKLITQNQNQSILINTDRQTQEEIIEQLQKETEGNYNIKVQKVYNFEINAYYSITFQEFCELDAPFFFWGELGSFIVLKTPYINSSLIQYYMNKNTNNLTLRIIRSSLSFDTTGSQNSMKYLCVFDQLGGN